MDRGAGPSTTISSTSQQQRDQFEMARRLRQQAAREVELEDELSRLRSAVAKLDRDKDEMRAELDRKDEKLARINTEWEKQMAELSRLQLALKNTEYQLGHTGDTAREHEREVSLLKRQIECLRRDLEVAAAERDEAVKDCRRLAGAVSKEEIERRSLNSEYEKKSKEAEELRKQVQKYIEEVRRIEDLLLQKVKEYTIFPVLIQQKHAPPVAGLDMDMLSFLKIDPKKQSSAPLSSEFPISLDDLVIPSVCFLLLILINAFAY
jgi:chromosome segregation ATPase